LNDFYSRLNFAFVVSYIFFLHIFSTVSVVNNDMVPLKLSIVPWWDINLHCTFFCSSWFPFFAVTRILDFHTQNSLRWIQFTIMVFRKNTMWQWQVWGRVGIRMRSETITGQIYTYWVGIRILKTQFKKFK